MLASLSCGAKHFKGIHALPHIAAGTYLSDASGANAASDDLLVLRTFIEKSSKSVIDILFHTQAEHSGRKQLSSKGGLWPTIRVDVSKWIQRLTMTGANSARRA